MLGEVFLTPVDERHDGHVQDNSESSVMVFGLHAFLTPDDEGHDRHQERDPAQRNETKQVIHWKSPELLKRSATNCPINKIDTTNSAILPQISARYRRWASLSVIVPA